MPGRRMTLNRIIQPRRESDPKQPMHYKEDPNYNK